MARGSILWLNFYEKENIMPAKLNTEFNYRYQVDGHTPWEKIKQLKNFLEGRKRAYALKEVSNLKQRAKIEELKYLKENGGLLHVILNLEAEILEIGSWLETEEEAFKLTEQEIKILEKILSELYEIVEPTRAKHEDGTFFTDEEMFELNAANEFTVMIGREIYAEIVATGRPSPMRVRNAMSNPYTLSALKGAGLLPDQMQFIEGNPDPLKIEINQKFYPKNLPPPKILEMTTNGTNSNLNLLEEKGISFGD